ncbi:hypothetical protein [Silvimonas iriomotensis]|uniref:Uncharacterized protein n=1 Tax=Silvimonas iriomotensis TaxID=449662 RepID=A0ABQ2PDH7_9NEIS|nr:hypothetical protein [Silvimonas iriomotensis]GGP23418.1 hypothetical protein GCM10010970_34180 [Silvimonas iriomotensis]
MKRTLAVLLVAAVVGGFATHAAFNIVDRIKVAEAQALAAVDLATASHGVGSLTAPDTLGGVALPAAQASLSALQAGEQ